MNNLLCFRHKGGQFLKALSFLQSLCQGNICPRSFVWENLFPSTTMVFVTNADELHDQALLKACSSTREWEIFYFIALIIGYINKTHTHIHIVELKTLYFSFDWLLYYKTVLIFALPFRRGIKIGFQRLRVFVSHCFTIVTQRKTLFDVISLLGDLVIAYRTNFVVISCQEH